MIRAAVLGADVSKSRSPAIHRAAFRALRVEGTYEALSVDVLPSLEPMDAALIDGDHNWYTVYNELKMLAEGSRRGGAPLPVIVMHDVLWPQGLGDWTTAAGLVILAAAGGLATAATLVARRGVVSRS